MEASVAFRGSLEGEGLLSTKIFKHPCGGLFIGSKEQGWLLFPLTILRFYQTKASVPTSKGVLSGDREEFFISSYFL